MKDSETLLIKAFFDCIAKLMDANIIRSNTSIGDIGEWLCVHKYGLKLNESSRHPGFDGWIGQEKVQVKLHNSPKGKNLNVGNPDKYDKLIILLGPNSYLRVHDSVISFHAYNFTSSEVKQLMKRKRGYFCAKKICNINPYESIIL